MPTSTWRLRVVWRLAMSIAPIAMPFHTDEEPMRNHGSTASSLEAAPSPIGPTIWSAGIWISSTSIGPDWLPRRPSASHSDGWDLTYSPSMTNTDRSS
jgi:hypothetical protein